MLDRGISFFFVNMINFIAVIATHKKIHIEKEEYSPHMCIEHIYVCLI